MKWFIQHIPLFGSIFVAVGTIVAHPTSPETYSIAAGIILAALSGGPKKATAK